MSIHSISSHVISSYEAIASNMEQKKIGYLAGREVSSQYESSLTKMIPLSVKALFEKIGALFFGSKEQVINEKAIEEFDQFYQHVKPVITQAKALLRSGSKEEKIVGLKLFKELLSTKAEIDVSQLYDQLFQANLHQKKFQIELKIANDGYLYLPIQEQRELRDQLTQVNAELRKTNGGYLSETYRQFEQEINELKRIYSLHKNDVEVLSEEKMDASVLRTEEDEELFQTIRWAESNDEQRKLAVLSISKALPFRAEEVPAGAVMLTNVDLWYKSLKIRKLPFSLSKAFRLFKAWITELFSGKGVIHAEICIGNSKFLHQDDSPSGGLFGVTLIDQRERKRNRITGQVESRVLPHEIVFPIAERMFPKLSTKKANQKLKSTISVIQDKAETGGYNVITTIGSMLRSGLSNFISMRGKDYQPISPLKDHDPKFPERTAPLSCSSTVASIYADHGLDMGNHLNKPLDAIDPADFLRSGYFRPIYLSGSYSFEDPTQKSE